MPNKLSSILEDEIEAEGKKSVKREDFISKSIEVQPYRAGYDYHLEKRIECRIHGLVN